MFSSSYRGKESVPDNKHIVHLHVLDFIVIITGFQISDPNTGKYMYNNKIIYCFNKLQGEMDWTNYTKTSDIFQITAGPLQDTVLFTYVVYTIACILTDSPGNFGITTPPVAVQ